MGDKFERLISYLGGKLPNEMSREKICESLEMLAKLKEDHPEIDMNYVITGKRENVNIRAHTNFVKSEVTYEDNSSHYERTVVVHNCEKFNLLKDQIKDKGSTIDFLTDLINKLQKD